MSVLEHVRGQSTRILVINPNSSRAMSKGTKHVIDSLDLPHSTQVDIYTAPSPASPGSIDDAEGIEASSKAVLGDSALISRLQNNEYDGVVIACYSVDPLVHELADAAAGQGSTAQMTTTEKKKKLVVTGIFEASILTALSLLPPSPHGEQPRKWGIVTTGAFWEEHLTHGVADFLGQSQQSRANAKFAGVHTTGLNAGDFHAGVPPEEVERRLKVATKKCLDGGRTHVVIMGCAGMAGLEGIIRAAAAEEYGDEFAYGQLHVLDAVRAGVMQIEQMIKHQRLLR
ncbi:hypothetical protein Micbo1qcDRAFT_21689 [Microdochium bolleyi]|uniref:Asp/Glu/hydantoin racemase n=1 Tax=Microdochium bolleyi TaxID=196109 RepID=A0A136IS97_9PEZI|nr:hypothetical protein Micbo1qcDRAFT_21689 [Microdochium bolleyi]